MRIKAITIENFKGISEPVRVEFKPITLLFGANSCGKSSIIQALHYIREVLEFRRLDVDKTISGGEFIDLGGFDKFVHGHDINRRVSFTVELDHVDNKKYGWDMIYGDDESEKLLESNEPKLYFSIAKINDKVCIDRFEIRLNDKVTKIGIRSDNKMHYCRCEEQPVFNISVFRDLLDDGEKFKILSEILPFKVRDAILNPLPEYGEVSPFRAWAPDSFDCDDMAYDYAERSIIGTIVDELRTMLYVGPLRTIPPRNYSPQKTFAPSRWADGLAAWDKASYAKNDEIARVNQWLHGDDKLKGLNTGYKLKEKLTIPAEHPAFVELATAPRLSLKERQDLLESIPRKREVALIQEKDEIEVKLCDVGVGISQSFPIVMAALDETAKLIIIEQPELHIHPRLQVELGDLFIAAAKSGKCMIIETHSEHLILRLMRRMRETFNKNLPAGILEINPSDVSIIYVQPSDHGPVMRLLELDAEGKLLDPWPGGFFEEGFRERFA